VQFDTGNFIDGDARFNTYDVEVHGLDAQLKLLAKNHPKSVPTYAVWGDDHEGWYAQREGIDVGAYAQDIMQKRGHQWFDGGMLVSAMMPDQVAPPCAALGYRPTRPEMSGTTATSRANGTAGQHWWSTGNAAPRSSAPLVAAIATARRATGSASPTPRRTTTPTARMRFRTRAWPCTAG
jgi:hypothetical protein